MNDRQGRALHQKEELGGQEGGLMSWVSREVVGPERGVTCRHVLLTKYTRGHQETAVIIQNRTTYLNYK